MNPQMKRRIGNAIRGRAGRRRGGGEVIDILMILIQMHLRIPVGGRSERAGRKSQHLILMPVNQMIHALEGKQSAQTKGAGNTIMKRTSKLLAAKYCIKIFLFF
uniref:Uncharacterized protein n=1 Tax=Rhizophora mucronata TaxID=61149 RepID=A0A2P2IPB6_RHIMU